ncbi:hypothetical protein [Rhodococcus erythropolis]|uniref:hypothetical protein n=1 Tax=Rhodococcus erythropolis TaxID=1833 RepID=UPI0036DE6483
MTQYGYRVFAVSLHENRKFELQPFGKAKRPILGDDNKPTSGSYVSDYRDTIVIDVEEAAGRALTFGISEEEDDETGAAQAKGMAIRFVGAKRSGDLVQLKFEQGVRNADGTLLIEGADDIELKDKPTLHPYRALFLAGDTEVRALLAVEVRGRSCPVDAVIRGLKQSSEVPWRLQVLGHLAGEAAMKEFIRNAAVGRVVFDRYTYADDGAKSQHDVSMSVTADGVDVKSKVSSWADSFFERRNRKADPDIDLPTVDATGKKFTKKQLAAARKQIRQERKAALESEEKTRREAVQTTSEAAAAGLKQDIFVSRDEVVDVEFTDVAVELDDGVIKKRITPKTDFGRFTYVLGRGTVSDDAFFTSSEKTLRGLFGAVQSLNLKR